MAIRLRKEYGPLIMVFWRIIENCIFWHNWRLVGYAIMLFQKPIFTLHKHPLNLS